MAVSSAPAKVAPRRQQAAQRTAVLQVMIWRYVSSSRSRLLRLWICSSSPSQTWLVVRPMTREANWESRLEQRWKLWLMR